MTDGAVAVVEHVRARGPEKTRIAFQVRMSFAAVVPKTRNLDGHLVLARPCRERPDFLLPQDAMRRVLYSVAMSLDGYIARPQDEFDWIPMDPAIDWGAFMSRFDTVLVGRRTFEIATRGGSGQLARHANLCFLANAPLHRSPECHSRG